jgi:uncharacterized protein YdeI (YjbR/CyaY-like superfamily)
VCDRPPPPELLRAEVPVLLAVAHDCAEQIGLGVDGPAVPVHGPTVQDDLLLVDATRTQCHSGIITSRILSFNGPLADRREGVPHRLVGDTVNAVDLPELVVGDAGEWRRWLSAHHADSPGVWLVLAKKGTVGPTTVSYDEALDEAICFGWIDGQLGRRDNVTFRRRFTPRRARSPWSRRNAAIAERLIATGRMHRTGEDEVRQAKEDGRWEAAYAGQASIEIPEDLTTALSANPRAEAMFGRLTSANRYAILYRIGNAKKPETRSRRIGQFVEMLARGETIHPQAP